MVLVSFLLHCNASNLVLEILKYDKTPFPVGNGIPFQHSTLFPRQTFWIRPCSPRIPARFAPLARSVVCVSVCLSVCRSYGCPVKKMVEPIKMPFDDWLERGPVNHVLDEVKIGQIHSQLREVISRRCVLSPKYSGQLLFNRSFFSKLKCAASSVENQQVLRFLWFYQKCQYIKWCSKDEKHESLKVGEGKTIKYTLVDSDVISSFLYMPAVLAAIM